RGGPGVASAIEVIGPASAAASAIATVVATAVASATEVTVLDSEIVVIGPASVTAGIGPASVTVETGLRSETGCRARTGRSRVPHPDTRASTTRTAIRMSITTATSTSTTRTEHA